MMRTVQAFLLADRAEIYAAACVAGILPPDAWGAEEQWSKGRFFRFYSEDAVACAAVPVGATLFLSPTRTMTFIGWEILPGSGGAWPEDSEDSAQKKRLSRALNPGRYKRPTDLVINTSARISPEADEILEEFAAARHLSKSAALDTILRELGWKAERTKSK